jgi:putative RNA 2'-phosphotransferase
VSGVSVQVSGKNGFHYHSFSDVFLKPETIFAMLHHSSSIKILKRFDVCCMSNMIGVVMQMDQKKEIKKYAKFLAYILGYRPDEFGLVPDRNGFVKIKEFLKAITEESGWKFFRRSNIDEILITLIDPPIEIVGNAIRSKNREHLKERLFLEHPPRILYTAIRQRAYPSSIERGIRPMGRAHVILASEKEMAQRIGKRVDRQPTILTVNTFAAIQNGSLFFQCGENLFLSRYIAPDCFTGPPLPKEPGETVKKEAVRPRQRDKTPGSFFPETQVDSMEKARIKKQRRRRKIGWKEQRKRMRRR